MLESWLFLVKGHAHREDGAAMLDGLHAPRREARAVADSLHLVEDRMIGIAPEQEVAVHGMGRARLRNGPHCGDERLSQNLSAVDPLPTLARTLAAEQVLFKLLQVQYGQERGEGRGWLGSFGGHGNLALEVERLG